MERPSLRSEDFCEAYRFPLASIAARPNERGRSGRRGNQGGARSASPSSPRSRNEGNIGAERAELATKRREPRGDDRASGRPASAGPPNSRAHRGHVPPRDPRASAPTRLGAAGGAGRAPARRPTRLPCPRRRAGRLRAAAGEGLLDLAGSLRRQAPVSAPFSRGFRGWRGEAPSAGRAAKLARGRNLPLRLELRTFHDRLGPARLARESLSRGA